MGTIRLHPNDCAKYGAPEVVEFELTGIGVKQRAAFEKSPTGPRKPLRWLFDQLAGVPELDEAGNPIPEPVLKDDGTPELNDDGSPVVTEKLTRDPESIAMLVWLVLWGAGIRVPWDDFDVREIGLRVRIGDEDDGSEDPGKAEEPTDSESTTLP